MLYISRCKLSKMFKYKLIKLFIDQHLFKSSNNKAKSEFL